MKCLVSCPHRLLLVDLQRRDVAVVESHRREYYGISWTSDGRRLCLSHSGVDNGSLLTMASYLNAERGRLSLGDRLGPPCLAAPHQLLCLDSHVVVTNTGRNCLTLFNPGDLFYRNHWLDDVRWDRMGRDNPCGSHFNSLYYSDGRLYVLAHNFDRGSYILVLSWPGLEVVERVETSARHGHNVWPQENGDLLICDSMAGALVEARSGAVVFRTDAGMTRGLACHGDLVVIGLSPVCPPHARPDVDGRIALVDRRTWRQIDEILLPAAGCVHDIRLVDVPDECHHGRPLLDLPPDSPEADDRRRVVFAMSGPERDSKPRMAPERKPFRIGVWNRAYGPPPQEDEGRLVHALTRDFDGFVRHLAEAVDGEPIELVCLDRSSRLARLMVLIEKVGKPAARLRRLPGRLLRHLTASVTRLPREKPTAVLVLPLLFLLAWLGSVVVRLLAALLELVGFPLRFVQKVLLRCRARARQTALARLADCDLWLVPAQREDDAAHWVSQVDWAVSPQRLLLPAALVLDGQVLPIHESSRAFILVAGRPGRRFLDELRRALGEIQPALGHKRLVEVVLLEKVGEARRRAALYRQAVVTLLPEFDVDTIPLLCEALHGGCPVACTNAPALTPWLERFGDCLPLFHPHHADTIVQAVQFAAADREWVHSLQVEAGQSLLRRSWKDVAGECLSWARNQRKTAEPGDQGPPMRSYLQTFSGK